MRKQVLEIFRRRPGKARKAGHLWCLAFCVFLSAALAGACLCLFGWLLPRWSASLSFAVGAWSAVAAPSEAGQASAPNQGGPDFAALESFLGNAFFLWQASAGLMANAHWAEEWRAGAADVLLRVLQAAQWLPFPFLACRAAAAAVRRMPAQGKEREKTKALLAWESLWGKASPLIAKAKGALGGYLGKPSKGRRWKAVWAAEVFLMSPLGPMVLDFLTGYFYLMLTLRTDALWPTLLSMGADLLATLRGLGAWNLLLAGYLVYRILRHSALSTLRRMQAANYERAKTPAVGIFTAGQPGSGKTQMDTSMAIDYQYLLRDQLLGNMRQARGAFPRFPWAELEAWANRRTRPRPHRVPAVLNRFGTVLTPPFDETTSDPPALHTRAQIELAVKTSYRRWSSLGKAPETGGAQLFFGYDGNRNPTTYFDGAKEWSLEDAAVSYAQSYFLYNSGVSLMTSNYSILDRTGEELSSFSLYGSASDYLAKGCGRPQKPCGYSQVLEWDPFRFGEKVSPERAGGQAGHFDGGAWVGDELNLERGNRNVHYGKGKGGGTTPENDGFNYSPRVWRHLFSINGKCISKIFGNGQRIGATNGDLMSIFEQVDWIEENGGEENALPLWGVDEAVCSLVCRISDSWAELLKNKELRQNLPARLAFLASEPFRDHLERMRNSYGYERLRVSSSLAKNEESGGGSSETYEYYNIWRKMRAYTYRTDAFHALVGQQSLGSPEGYLQAPHYKGLDPSAENYDDSASYIVKTMVDCMSEYQGLANGKADEIAAMAEKGTGE